MGSLTSFAREARKINSEQVTSISIFAFVLDVDLRESLAVRVADLEENLRQTEPKLGVKVWASVCLAR
jgi:hypothetical protein